MTRPKVYVLHALREDSRSTTINHAGCFGRYMIGCNVEYINIFGEIPTQTDSDMVIVTYELIGLRNLPIWNILRQRMAPVLRNATIRVLMPQDDYSRSDVLDEFVASENFDFVFSPITRDLGQLYPKSLEQGVQFHEAFTGYFEQSDWAYLQQFSKPFNERSIDVGQRVRYLPPQFGERAWKKGLQAVKFALMASERGFVCDVSTKSEDVFVGDEWWKFLGNLKFTVSRRGGASMADSTGRLADKVRRYQFRHPEVKIEELSQRLSFKGEREGDFSAISPRLFEAATMGVCQILEPDQYVDGLKPWVHYLPLFEDFSNIEEVLDVMRDDDRCSEIVKASQEILLHNNNFTYSAFVERLCKITKLEQNVELGSSFSDSSDSYNACIGEQSGSLAWVQGYVERGFLKRKLTSAIESLKVGKLLLLDEKDAAWANHAEAHSESLILWLNSFKNRELIIESYVIPWRSMSSFVSREN